jgi:hypothetical protein
MRDRGTRTCRKPVVRRMERHVREACAYIARGSTAQKATVENENMAEVMTRSGEAGAVKRIIGLGEQRRMAAGMKNNGCG